jgi:hypothetical protein
MKKTIMIVLVVLLVAPMGLFAGIFDFSIGATAQYTEAFNATEEVELADGMAEIENYVFGADIRTRLLFAEVGLMGLYSEAENGFNLDGVLTGGLSLDLLGLVRVGLGMGPRLSANFQDDGTIVVYGPDGPLTEETDFEAAFMNAPMTYRATVDLKLGSILLGLNYTVDSNGFTFSNPEAVDNLNPNWEQGRIGASVLLTLF